MVAQEYRTSMLDPSREAARIELKGGSKRKLRGPV